MHLSKIQRNIQHLDLEEKKEQKKKIGCVVSLLDRKYLERIEFSDLELLLGYNALK